MQVTSLEWNNQKMLIIFHLLLILRVGRCTEEPTLETKIVRVGDNVNLTCTRKNVGSLFWIRLVSGAFPEVLGKTSFILETVDRRFTFSKHPGTFDLHIKRAQLGDTGVYVCLKTQQQDFTFLKETVLRVEEPEPHTTAVPTTDPVHPGDSVTLHCSVSQNRTCPEENSMYCFNDTQGNTTGTYCCSVASCGVRNSANRSKPTTEGVNIKHSEKDDTVISLLSAALAISVLVIAFLVYLIQKLQKKSCGCCNASVVLQRNATASEIQESQQTDENSLVYSAPSFTSRRVSKAERKDAKPSEEESIYTDVRALALE